MKKVLILASLALVMASCGEDKKDYDATGTFEATEVTVSAESSGQLISFQVTEGQLLNSGVTVGQIDARQLSLKRAQLATNTEQLTATDGQLDANKRQLVANQQATASKQLDLKKQVAAIRQQIANQQRERQRFSELLRDGAVPQKQVDDIDYQIQVLQKQLVATEEQIASQNAALAEQNKGIAAQIDGISSQQAGVTAQKAGVRNQQAQIDDQIAHTFVKSPLAGTILEKYAEQGEFVTIGKPLFKIADTKNMFIKAYITSEQLKKVRLGQHVKVLADYGGGEKKQYNGVITWISSRSEFTPKTIVTEDERADLVYAIKIKFTNDGFVKIGMYGEVKF
ncbi:HlyD family secretion protein [Prevotella aurantiaca]|jgi:hlyD family secretion protein|uniref:HlyD family efflux transporter periplasmic adaptor subunit n=1 Tax=Prevotella aurantiaca TaxID=596085 RepID=A0A930HM38_9BACT|nr:HlyD family efflux transporter periplasmic adaptor subunit [Prevotella aurantiaca]MBF1384213.1 HlyD family efflux transporter periplasmic adaptor subunit [Prevotella aurantiaca]